LDGEHDTSLIVPEIAGFELDELRSIAATTSGWRIRNVTDST
jgi:hypothetical protein